MQARPYHEGPSASSSIVASRPQVGPASSALSHPQPNPVARKEKRRTMVLRRKRTRRLLLRTGHDHAGTARGPGKGCNLLPWRSNHGAAERLGRLFDLLVTSGTRLGTTQFHCLPEGYLLELGSEETPVPAPGASPIIGSQNPVLAGARSSIGKSIGFLTARTSAVPYIFQHFTCGSLWLD